MTPTPPPELVAKLQRFDPLLRLHWARHQATWFIERKMPPGFPEVQAAPKSLKSKRNQDLYDSLADGYVHVLTVPPELIHDYPTIFDALREADAWRQGGMAGINARLDAMAAKDEAEADRKIQDFVQTATSDAYDRLKWLSGERVAVATAEAPLVDTGLGFKVRDRRLVSA